MFLLLHFYNCQKVWIKPLGTTGLNHPSPYLLCVHTTVTFVFLLLKIAMSSRHHPAVGTSLVGSIHRVKYIVYIKA